MYNKNLPFGWFVFIENQTDNILLLNNYFGKVCVDWRNNGTKA